MVNADPLGGAAKPFWRAAGPWMAAAGAALMFFNTARAFADPGGFARYLGMPLADLADAGLVNVYALRALFVGVLVILLLAAREGRALALLAFAAVVMPVGDAVLTFQAGAPAATVARHIGIALFLLATGILLWRGRFPSKASSR